MKHFESPQAHGARIQWWRDARFGMFIHWRLYSIPAGVRKGKVHAEGYSEWIMFGEKIPPPYGDYISTGDNEIAD